MSGRRNVGIALGMLLCCLNACVSPQVNSRLRAIEARQDSILTLLKSMQDKNDFMAQRLGWQPPPDTGFKDIPVGNSFTRGPADAAVTVVEFSDLQCPYCAMLAPILDSVSKAYPRDVRLVFKNFPLNIHPQAREAAAAAIAAGKQGKFYDFRFKLAPLYRQLSDSLYLAASQELGLNMDEFKKEMPLTPAVNHILDQDIALGEKLGVEGTPTVFVNGHLATDRSFQYFANLIAAAKAKHQ